ncbi:uncharacterized protein LOC110423969 isoform X2 [Herrania umbratica]|uniref:Uncharacterized protein LOC110423969 isoform X2 n=1 Tax=Herrania umbratica TaxID=108875 RepID=A0A6J1B3Y8_9ROSI|nr:uncharacterized protein LOC110423969 isoform X2 [Herrania umbratica]
MLLFHSFLRQSLLSLCQPFSYNKTFFSCLSFDLVVIDQTSKMGSVSLPTPVYNHQAATSNPVLLISQERIHHQPSLHQNLRVITFVSGKFQSRHVKRSLIPATYPTRRRGLSVVPLDAKTKSSDSGAEEDSGALETVLKLYSAIKNQNVRELSDIIDDECQCICNFFSSFQPLQGKEQVLEFFASLIKFLGDHIEFVVQPTLHDGMVVGIHWRLEWNKAHMPLGKGFSFYTCQIYHGRVVIRNVEMFMEPLLHVEPLRLKTIGYLTTMVDKISFGVSSKAWKKKALCALLGLLFISAILLFSKLY